MGVDGAGRRPGDWKTRDAVGRPEESFLVRAPAGAGKTQLLAERYVRLLATPNVGPDNIVCLTFSRKAAGEMRRRIVEILMATIDPGAADARTRPVGERLRTLVGKAGTEALLKDHGDAAAVKRQMTVQTIDAFQRAVVLADSLRSRVMPHFGRAEGARYYDRAVARDAGMSEVHERLEGVFSGTEVHRKAVAMLAKRDQWVERGDGAAGSGGEVLEGLRRVEDGLDRIYAMEGKYDYIAVSTAAQRLVASASREELGSVLGRSVRHMLVDEFQDVSAAQCGFLKAFVAKWKAGDGTSFFAVGDSMQSIYRFRGAGTDVVFDLFEGRGGGGSGGRRPVPFGGKRLAVKELRVNFRSRPGVVKGVRTLLERGPEGTVEERLRRGVALLRKATAYRGGRGTFRVERFPDEEREAAWVAAKMEASRAREEELVVLVRARSYYSRHIEPVLRDRRGIDVDFAPLGRQACVRDMIALGRSLEEAGDPLACLALLRSPLVGLSSGEIVRLYRWLGRVRAAEGGGGLATPLEAVLSAGVEVKLADVIGELGEAALREWVAAVWRGRAEVDRLSVRGRLERAWLRMGGGAVYCREEDLKNLEELLDLVERVSGGGAYCDWGELEGAMRGRCGASPCPGAKVRVMTIHAAKGLEFERVVVPFLHKGGRDPWRDLVMFRKGSGGDGREVREAVCDDGAKVDCSKGGNGEYARLRCAELGRYREEVRRLVYVAATRAKEECWLTCSGAKGRGGPGSMMAAIGGVDRALSAGRESFRDGGVREARASGVGDGGGEAGGDDVVGGEIGGRRRVGRFKAVRGHMGGIRGLYGAPVGRAAVGGRRRAALGEVVHEELVSMLEEWPGEGVDGRVEDEGWKWECGRRLRETGWSRAGGGVKRGVEEVAAHLRKAYADPGVKRLAELAAAGDGEWVVEFEKEFQSDADLCGDGWQGGVKRLDVLIRSRDGRECVVIDFKTGGGGGDGNGARPECEHVRQVECYKKLVREAWGGCSVATALYYTATGEWFVVSEERIAEGILGDVRSR